MIGCSGTRQRSLAGRGTLLALCAAGLLAVAASAGGLWYWQRIGQRQRRYDPIIWEAVRRHHVSPLLVKAVIKQESNFRADARGDKGEIGLMQITSGAVKEWERKTRQCSPSMGMLYDPRLNIEIGTWYLARMLRLWNGYQDSEVLALASYNAGLGRAREWAPEDPRGKALERVRYPMTKMYIEKVFEYRLRYEKDYLARD